MTRWFMFGWVVLLVVLPSLLSAQTDEGRAGVVVATATVGIEGRLVYRYTGKALRAKTFTPKSPLVVRIVSSTTDGGATLYDLRFIGVKPGRFDLREVMQREDGHDLHDAPAAIVEVGSVLSATHTGELIESGGTVLPRLGGYRLVILVLAVAWAVPVLSWARRRIMRRTILREAPVPEQAPTLADQLRPLVSAALAGTATTQDLAHIERLMIAHWRERIGLGHRTTLEALVALKSHAEAGAVVRSVESWLHRPREGDDEAVDLAALLEPFTREKPIMLATPESPPVRGRGT